MKVILASASPRRKELLKKSIPSFDVRPADIDETIQEHEYPLVYVKRMAKEKALAVNACKDELVIGCDTIVVSNGTVMGKPVSENEARRMLKELSGNSHQVLTSVFMIYKDKVFQKTEDVEVTFYPLEEKDIEDYIKTKEYEDKAGAYGIQGQGALFVKAIMGDYYAIVGFPIGAVHQTLKKWKSEEDER